ncbi:MAG: hypothetical protein ACJ780_22125, partial [Solirubrobacteraceae bacterium]
PRHSIIAFEVGNEPDIYSRGDWRTVIAGRRFDGRLLAGPSLPPVLTARDYVRDFRGYAAMPDEVAPHVNAARAGQPDPPPALQRRGIDGDGGRVPCCARAWTASTCMSARTPSTRPSRCPRRVCRRDRCSMASSCSRAPSGPGRGW